VAMEAAQLVQLRIGNNYELLGFQGTRLTHKWSLEVKLEPHPEGGILPVGAELPDLIEHVRFGLKPAHRVLCQGSQPLPEEEWQKPAPSYVEVREAPFAITCSSWIATTIPIVVTWKEWLGQPPLRLDHSLDFHREGGSWDYGVDLTSAFEGNSAGVSMPPGGDLHLADVRLGPTFPVRTDAMPPPFTRNDRRDNFIASSVSRRAEAPANSTGKRPSRSASLARSVRKLGVLRSLRAACGR